MKSEGLDQYIYKASELLSIFFSEYIFARIWQFHSFKKCQQQYLIPKSSLQNLDGIFTYEFKV